MQAIIYALMESHDFSMVHDQIAYKATYNFVSLLSRYYFQT